MSQTFSIACTKCKKHIWIAQASYGDKLKGHLYSAKKYSEALFQFLMEHQGHPLIFDENCEGDIADFEEIGTVDDVAEMIEKIRTLLNDHPIASVDYDRLEKQSLTFLEDFYEQLQEDLKAT